MSTANEKYSHNPIVGQIHGPVERWPESENWRLSGAGIDDWEALTYSKAHGTRKYNLK